MFPEKRKTDLRSYLPLMLDPQHGYAECTSICRILCEVQLVNKVICSQPSISQFLDYGLFVSNLNSCGTVCLRNALLGM